MIGNILHILKLFSLQGNFWVPFANFSWTFPCYLALLIDKNQTTSRELRDNIYFILPLIFHPKDLPIILIALNYKYDKAY